MSGSSSGSSTGREQGTLENSCGGRYRSGNLEGDRVQSVGYGHDRRCERRAHSSKLRVLELERQVADWQVTSMPEVLYMGLSTFFLAALCIPGLHKAGGPTAVITMQMTEKFRGSHMIRNKARRA